ncbi:MAG: LOG family protein, partial [Mucispirillum sp.]|nr:LOG family protein [Mucispirillum sp.]
RNVKGYILVPGGYGTLDELFETLTLVATDIRDKTPIILIGVSFWQGLIDWIKTSLLKEKFINDKELDLIYLTDNVEDAVKFISSAQNLD